MKTLIITISLILGIQTIYGRELKKLDTIYANERMNVALFFPTDIRQGIVGSKEFVFTYNRELGQPLGLLKASKGEPSNLLVITTDGKVYSYIIKYADVLTELNRFISVNNSIGDEHSREKEVVLDTVQPAVNRVKPKVHDTSFLEKSCKSLLERPERMNVVKRQKGLSLSIKNRVYYENLVFLQFEVKNSSGIDFDIDRLDAAVVSGNGKRKASFQLVELEPIYVYKMPDKIRNGGSTRFVYVLPKYVLSDNEKLKISLKELNGNREVLLKGKL